MSYYIVRIVQGPKVLLSNTVVQLDSDKSFLDLFEKSVATNAQVDRAEISVDKILKASLGNMKDNVVSFNIDVPVADLRTPVSLADRCQQNVITFFVENPTQPSTSTPTTSLNPFQLMMARELKLPSAIDASGRELTGRELQHNKVNAWLKSTGAGWPKQEGLETGNRVIKVISAALWYVDGQMDKFTKQGISIPVEFKDLFGFRNYEKTHHKKPAITQFDLNEHCTSLANIISLPSFTRKENQEAATGIEKLLNFLTKYLDHLRMDAELHLQSHAQVTPKEQDHPMIALKPREKISPTYKRLNEVLAKKKFFEVIDLTNLAPKDALERRSYIKHIEVSVPCTLYRIAYLGGTGTLNFIWKADDEEKDKISEEAKIVLEIDKVRPKYISRACRKRFIDKYFSFVNTPKSVLRHIYSELTGTVFSAESAAEKELDERVMKFLVASDDPDILLDHRGVSSTGKTKFEKFFSEVEAYFEEYMSGLCVNDRRHGSVLYLPCATSLEDLRLKVKDRVSEDTLIPHKETLRLQFHPARVTAAVSSKYTGRLNCKFRVQSRLLRQDHQDSKYVAVYYKYLKHFAVKHKEYVTFICMDDKAIVPVGLPDLPISTGVRPRNKTIVPDGAQLLACDHDFHVSGIVPSVILVPEIPQSPSDSFFSGSIFVLNKDKVFQASSPFRHAAEFIKTMRLHRSIDDVSLSTPVLTIFTDGGPDHRLTYDTVKFSLVEIFTCLDLDMLIALRTAPHNSWMNPAERVMSSLNFGLQHVALARDKMETKYEDCVKHRSTLGSYRQLAEDKPQFAAAYMESMADPIRILNERFQSISVNNEHIKCISSCETSDIEEILEELKGAIGLHPGLKQDQITAKYLKTCEQFRDFLKKHSRESHYCFQIRKCPPEEECSYCQGKLHLPRDVFAEMNWLPDPTPTQAPSHLEKYKTFDELYGQPTTDKHRPSLVKDKDISVDAVEKDRENREVFVNRRARCVIQCQECCKPRVIYGYHSLTWQKENELERFKNDYNYTCGSELPVADVFVKCAMSCSSDVEIVYYSMAQENVCIYCGTKEDLLGDFDPYIAELLEKFSRVRPICRGCRESGKDAATWGQKFSSKKQKKK